MDYEQARDVPAAERDARDDRDLDDGVMIDSAALWPLLEPQWKDEMAEEEGHHERE